MTITAASHGPRKQVQHLAELTKQNQAAPPAIEQNLISTIEMAWICPRGLQLDLLATAGHLHNQGENDPVRVTGRFPALSDAEIALRFPLINRQQLDVLH